MAATSTFFTLRSICASVVMLEMLGLPAAAQSIFKCVEGETIAYQSMPCANGQVEVRMAIVQAARPEIAPLSAATAAASSAPSIEPPRSNTWPRRRTLTLGMSDDEVLNLPG